MGHLRVYDGGGGGGGGIGEYVLKGNCGGFLNFLFFAFFNSP